MRANFIIECKHTRKDQYLPDGAEKPIEMSYFTDSLGREWSLTNFDGEIGKSYLLNLEIWKKFNSDTNRYNSGFNISPVKINSYHTKTTE